jgi:hypothetical protein
MRERASGSGEPGSTRPERPRLRPDSRDVAGSGTAGHSSALGGRSGEGGYLALQRVAGNRTVTALVGARAASPWSGGPIVAQRDKGGSKGGFRAVDDPAAEKEFAAKVAKYEKAGKSKQEAAFLAMDDMFAERVAEAGGKRTPKSATPGAGGTTTFVMVGAPIVHEGRTIAPSFYNATIDDSVYNCHSYTLDEGKKSKLSQLKGLARKVPKEGGDLAGTPYYEAQDLVANGIHFAPNVTLDIYPSWVGDAEMRSRLKDYTALRAGAKVKQGDIVVYSVGSALPHSGRVIAVDKGGTPTMIRSKWGHHSLFEHPPTAVPSHYGTPAYYRKK